MQDQPIPTLTASEATLLAEIGRQLREDDGWADFITVERLMTNWIELSRTVSLYPHSVDDYTNDLTSRDGLEIVLSRCTPGLREKLVSRIGAADREFVAGTRPDEANLLSSFFRIDDLSGWWWRRTPASGPLSDYLRDVGG